MTPVRHTCPACPHCRESVATPTMHDGRHTYDGPASLCSLWCPACGHQWTGTDADVALARRAYAAHLRYEAGQGRNVRARKPRGARRVQLKLPGAT